MGLLDDAIREHLDLKRRRGADPTEVERDEREALGPVRRAPEAGTGAERAEAAGAEPALAYDHEDESGWSHESFEGEPVAESRNGRDEPAPAAAFDDDPFADAEAESEPELDSAPREPHEPREAIAEPEPHPAPPPPHPAGGETMEYDVEEALGSEGHGKPGEDEDVLEETPEFLQDTPDHDRLWFEQRPPKDFDFEG